MTTEDKKPKEEISDDSPEALDGKALDEVQGGLLPKRLKPLDVRPEITRNVDDTFLTIDARSLSNINPLKR